MALIKCPNCGRVISDDLEACPNCNLDLRNERNQKEKKNKRKAIIFAIVVVALAIFAVCMIKYTQTINGYLDEVDKVIEAYNYISVHRGERGDANIMMMEHAEERVFVSTIHSLCYDYEHFKNNKRVMNAITYNITPKMISLYKELDKEQSPEWERDYANDELLNIIGGN